MWDRGVRASEMAVVRIGGRQSSAKSWNREGGVGTAIREGTPRRAGFPQGQAGALAGRV